MAQQRGMKRAEKVAKRKARLAKTQRENNLKKVAQMHAGHDHDHDHDHDHEHEHEHKAAKSKKK